jgi:hypothetical protein
VATFAHVEHDFSLFKEKTNDGVHPYCPTDDLWDWKLKNMGGKINTTGACPQYTACDDPAIRDQYADVSVTISLVVVVLCEDVGAGNCVTTEANIVGQFNQLKSDFAAANIGFQLSETFHINSIYSTIAAYSNTNPKWFNDLMNLKNNYAFQPTKNINVFVTKQKAGNQGTLLGIGTFPWDEDFLSNYGGLWVNALYFGQGHKTLSHEFGHNLGLWHTFHGVSEIESCNDPCREDPHEKTDTNADLVGDRCRDTQSTPRNYECADPSGNFCGNAFNAKTDLDNIMGYTPDDCMNKISAMQSARAKCYLCRETPGILADSSQCPN